VAAAFVQSIEFTGSNVASSTALLNGVAAGNFLALGYGALYDTGNGNVASTDDKNGTYEVTVAPTTQAGGGGDNNAFLHYKENVLAGNTTATIDTGTGNQFIAGAFAEFSGIALTGSLDRQTSESVANGVDATPATGTTADTTQADEIAIAVCCVLDTVGFDASLGIDTPATVGYSNIGVEQDSSTFQGYAMDYKILAAIGGQSAAWGTLDGNYLNIGKIATFKAVAAPGANAPTERSASRFRLADLLTRSYGGLRARLTPGAKGWWKTASGVMVPA